MGLTGNMHGYSWHSDKSKNPDSLRMERARASEKEIICSPALAGHFEIEGFCTAPEVQGAAVDLRQSAGQQAAASARLLRPKSFERRLPPAVPTPL